MIVECSDDLCIIFADRCLVCRYSFCHLGLEGLKILIVLAEGIAYVSLIGIAKKYCYRIGTVRKVIIEEIGRGATIFHGEGGYKGEPRSVIYTIVTRRESTILRYRINKIDPGAFINVIDSKEILGNGFKPLDE
jgi:uncharacterized membrane-anchored protein YitT (DUF2179 family)